MRKALKLAASLTAATLTLACAVFAAPGAASAAVGDTHTSPLFTSTPTGTVADRSWTAPTGVGAPGLMGADDWGRSTLGTITEQPLTQSQVQHWGSAPIPFVWTPDAQRLGTYTGIRSSGGSSSDDWRFVVTSNRDAWGTGGNTAGESATYRHRLLVPQPTLTLDLAAQFPELGLSDFYVSGGNGQTGWLSSATKDCGLLSGASPQVNCAAMQGPDFSETGGTTGEPFSARGTATGVEFDLTPGDWSRGGQYFVTVSGFTSGGLNVSVRVELAVAAVGGAPTAGNLTYATPVNVPVVVPEADLAAAIEWRTSDERQVSIVGLAREFTPVDGGYSFVSAVPTSASFGFKGTERQAPAGIVESPAGMVTVTALAVEEPVVITAPAVRDYAFDAPLPQGDIVTGEGAASVPVISLTDGEGFDPTLWEIQAADVMPWSASGSELLLFPSATGEAFTTSWRWTLRSDPSVTSAWATVTAPAAEVVEPPVTEPPVVEPPVTEPPVTQPPATEPPATVPPAQEVPEVKQDAVKPASSEGARTGDELPWMALALALAYYLSLAVTGRLAVRRSRA